MLQFCYIVEIVSLSLRPWTIALTNVRKQPVRHLARIDAQVQVAAQLALARSSIHIASLWLILCVFFSVFDYDEAIRRRWSEREIERFARTNLFFFLFCPILAIVAAARSIGFFFMNVIFCCLVFIANWMEMFRVLIDRAIRFSCDFVLIPSFLGFACLRLIRIFTWLLHTFFV